MVLGGMKKGKKGEVRGAYKYVVYCIWVRAESD